MRSVEFFTYLLPNDRDDGKRLPARAKLTSWQAIAYPGATRIEGSREVRMCPESAAEQALLGVAGFEDDSSTIQR